MNIAEKYTSGFATQNNLDKWSNRAKLRRQQGSVQGPACSGRAWDENDWSDKWQVPQAKSEGRCFAKLNPAAEPNTYTTDKGTKRD
jgi:hypothetical protein